MDRSATHRAARTAKPALVGWLLAGVLALGPEGTAQSQDRRVAAESAFNEGLASFEKGQFAEACPKLGVAVDLTDRASLGGLLLFAECQEKIGHTASAWALYREAAAKAERANQADRVQKARDGEARVAPLLHQLTIRVPPAVAAIPGLRVKRGSVDLAPEMFGVGVPVDPGSIVVRAEAPGHLPQQQTVEISASAGKSEIVLGDLPRDPRSSTATPTGGKPASGSGGGLGGVGIAGLVTGGTGLACMGASALVMLSAKSSYDDAVAPCPGGTCATDAEKATVDDARGTGDIGTVLFVGGAVLTAVGTGLLVFDLASTRGETQTGSAQLRLGAGSLKMSGSF